MKRITFFLILITILVVGCKKENEDQIIDEEQELRESNLAFINSDWSFDVTGDSLKDQIIGLWLSDEVRYQDTICNECDSLFTWVIESTGTMVKRNNDWGDHETLYGDWEIDKVKNMIFFSYKVYPSAGSGDNSDNYQIMTDSINIEELSNYDLWVSQFIDYPPTTKLDIKFDKLK
jgi:hypothetical protein